MSFKNLAEIVAREVVTGFHGKFVHSDSITVAYWDIDAGAALPEHAHPHEQIITVLEGSFEFTLGGKTRIVEAGGIAIIPGGVPHGGHALTDCKIMDVFHPARDDYH